MAQRKRPPARGRQKTRPSGPTPRASAQRPREPQQNATPKPFLTPGGSPFRHAVERRSAVVALFLRGLPRPVPGLIVLGLVAAGLLAAPPVSPLVLLVVASLLGWLAFLAWPAIPTPGKLVRVVVIALVIGYALSRLAA
ncbi:MAG TPA: DUF6703 family protein [Frankiaceae bacterium]|nr:DUF6703 family protein [Frankiaceae bacterium]